MKNIYDKWLYSKKKLAEYKKTELELRDKIIDAFADGQVKGTLKFADGDYKIKIGLGINQSLDEGTLDTIWKKLSSKEQNCVKYKPSLIAKEMKLLDGNELLFEAITEKPRQATLEIDIEDE